MIACRYEMGGDCVLIVFCLRFVSYSIGTGMVEVALRQSIIDR